MMVFIISIMLLMISSSSQALWHHPKLKMYSDKRIYEIGENVTLSAEYTGKEAIILAHYFGGCHLVIYDQNYEPIYWSPKWTESGEIIYPGDVREWEWDQTYATWVKELNDFGYLDWVRAPNYGEQVSEGKYTAYQYNVGLCTFWIGSPDYPGASDSHRQDNGNGDACLNWALNEHAQGREHAADS